jgi:hypothetical protein
MSEVLNKAIVLSLNSKWQPINHYTVRKAITSLTSGLEDQPPLLALDLNYVIGENGEPDTEKLTYACPTAWADWIQLPVRPWDDFVQAHRGLRIRVPTVVIAPNYNGMPMYTPRPNSKSIFERDGGVCQYTNKYVGRRHGNLDHVISKDNGGKDTFENLVWCDAKVNSAKGNRHNHEVGLKLIRKPYAPKSVPRCVIMKEVKHPSWKHFLIK